MTFEIENTEPCMPAGRPILSISFIVAPSIFSFLRCSLIEESLLIRQTVTSMDEISYDTTVGTATPATPILKAVTNRISTAMLLKEDTARKIKGVLLSPRAEKTPVAML